MTRNEQRLLVELDALIGSACQRRGIQIPVLPESFKGDARRFGFTGIPYYNFAARDGRGMITFTTDNWEQAMNGLRLIASGAGLADSNDTVSDTPKNSRKKRKRSMNRAALDCARRFKAERRKDPTISMSDVVKEYVGERGGSAESIVRILNDNPDQWKPQESRKSTTKKRPKDDH
jgi:hypothetical protein